MCPATSRWHVHRPWDGMASHETTCPTIMPSSDPWTAALPHKILAVAITTLAMTAALDGKTFAPNRG